MKLSTENISQILLKLVRYFQII